jgi:proline iminopeptidase
LVIESVEGYVEVSGFKLYYRSFGEAAKGTILTLHGGPGATHDYMLPVSRLAEHGYRVVLYDMLGGGRSDFPQDMSLYAIERWAEEAEGVRRALDLGRVHLLGHSLGGSIAMTYALAHQQNLMSLTVSSGFASAPLLISEVLRLESELPAPSREAIRKAEESRDFKSQDYKNAVKEFMDRHYQRGLIDFNPPEHVYTLSHFNKLLYRTLWGPTEFRVTGTLKTWDISSKLGTLDLPCLITAGRYDEATPTVAMDLHRRIRGSKLVIFENSSHNAMLEERDEYIRTVAEFLDSVPTKA